MLKLSESRPIPSDICVLFQENPDSQQQEVKPWAMCGTGTVGSPRSTGACLAVPPVHPCFCPSLCFVGFKLLSDGGITDLLCCRAENYYPA